MKTKLPTSYSTINISPDKYVKPEDLKPPERRADRDWDNEYEDEDSELVELDFNDG